MTDKKGLTMNSQQASRPSLEQELLELKLRVDSVRERYLQEQEECKQTTPLSKHCECECKQTDEWEEFDKEFGSHEYGPLVHTHKFSESTDYKLIKDFIRTHFIPKKKVREYVEDRLNCYSNTDYRVALTDLLSSLQLTEDDR